MRGNVCYMIRDTYSTASTVHCSQSLTFRIHQYRTYILRSIINAIIPFPQLIRTIRQPFMSSWSTPHQLHQLGRIRIVIPRMGEVETSHRHSVRDEFVDHFFGVGGGSEGAYYFGHAAEGGGDLFELVEVAFLGVDRSLERFVK